jgi:hypothetical protein
MFRSTTGEANDRLCTACGRDPSLGIETPLRESFTTQPSTAPSERKRDRTTARKRRSSYLLVKLVVAWVLFLTAIVFGTRLYFQDGGEKPTSVATLPTPSDDTAAQDTTLLDRARPFYYQTLAGFLSAGTPESRNQFVINPIATAAKMARFYRMNPLVSIEPQTLSLDASAVIHLPTGPAIETQWHTTDDRVLDAVFIEEDGEWHLDWDHFARRCDYPWPLFLAGSGEDHGEFRLLARERLVTERKDAESISIVFYHPRFGSASETGSKSPEFLIPRNTTNGRLLDAAFTLDRSGQRPFGLKLKSTDPEGLIRVRVKVRRVVENQERRFVLDEVVACHWYSADAKGVDIPVIPVK